MRRSQVSIACLVLMTSLVQIAPADTVILVDGKTMDGVVRDHGGGSILLKTDTTDLWIPRTRIQEIKYESPPDYFVKLGDEKLAEGDIAAARAAYRQALDLDPENAVAKENMDKIAAMTSKEISLISKEKRLAEAEKQFMLAKELWDKTMEKQAIDALKKSIELNSEDPVTLLYAAEKALTAWNTQKAEESLFLDLLAQLEKVDPEHKSIESLKSTKATLDEKHRLRAVTERDQLYKEILTAQRLKKYDHAVMYKIESLLKSNPGPAMEAELKRIQEEARAAGVGKVKLSISSSVKETGREGPKAKATPKQETLYKGDPHRKSGMSSGYM